MQELGQLLREPLQAHVSKRFFAGRPAEQQGGAATPAELATRLATSHKAGKVSLPTLDTDGLHLLD